MPEKHITLKHRPPEPRILKRKVSGLRQGKRNKEKEKLHQVVLLLMIIKSSGDSFFGAFLMAYPIMLHFNKKRYIFALSH